MRSLRSIALFIERFMHTEAASGLAMFVAAALAFGIANSPFAGLYADTMHSALTLAFKDVQASHTLAEWIEKLPMATFFFLIGMELKHQTIDGFLSERKHIMLPLAAAVGGMAAPAGLYALMNYGHAESLRGWAIPTATDTAFALAALAVVGKRLPPSLKAFLLALAIFDDIGAILVIAFFYSESIHWGALGVAGLCCVALFMLNRRGVADLRAYVLLGAPLWLAFYFSGIHPTLAGVILGVFIPYGKSGASPLEHAIEGLHPWVAFGVLPVFAFVSAGVPLDEFSWPMLALPVPLGIIAGLCLGKPIGIMCGSALCRMAGAGALPEGANWLQLAGVACIAGIGFAMSFFIGFLAFYDPALQEQVKLGVMIASLVSAVAGIAFLKLILAGSATRPAH